MKKKIDSVNKRTSTKTGIISCLGFVLLATCSSCCLSADTKILARTISTSTDKQREEIVELFDAKLETGEKISDTQRGRIILKRVEKLVEATSGLADLLGAPKEVK
jgi:hypothetical protein